MERSTGSGPKSEPSVETGECTLEDIQAYAGVVVDRTGDYEAGRTAFYATPQEFLDYVASVVRESEGTLEGDAHIRANQSF